jgi:hypothetical protein
MKVFIIVCLNGLGYDLKREMLDFLMLHSNCQKLVRPKTSVVATRVSVIERNFRMKYILY